MWQRRFPYEQYNNWSQDLAEKRRWTEALEKQGPKRVEAELSDRALGSSASRAEHRSCLSLIAARGQDASDCDRRGTRARHGPSLRLWKKFCVHVRGQYGGRIPRGPTRNLQ